jgi:molybdopterin synthase sulfur carrier subunit
LFALRAALALQDPALGEALAGPGVRAAVDQTLVLDDADLSTTREVAFMPPMSGG